MISNTKNNHLNQRFDYSDQRIVIYSAGTFGQKLYNRLKYDENAEITLWVDDDYLECQKSGHDVSSVDSLKYVSFDKLIIATINKMQIDEAFSRLTALGIDKNKLITYTFNEEEKNDLLENFEK